MAGAPEIFTKHACTYCLDEIVGTRVRCVECTDFDLCLQCFSSGAEIGPHLNNHSYQFVDPGPVEVFRSKSKWTAREELELLAGIEQYGFGNWESISHHIQTRTPEEARDEYMSRYVEGAIGRCTWTEAYNKRTQSYGVGKCESTPIPPLPPPPPLSLISPEITLPLDVTPLEATHLGYMPNRGDFEREHQNEAESLVSHLCLSVVQEDDLDIALKLAQVDVYMDKLRERAFRKKIVNDCQLVSKFYAERRERHPRRRTTVEQDIEDKLKFVCRLGGPEAHDSLVRGVLRQRELGLRLNHLLRYRRAGLTHYEEIAHYEQEMAASSTNNNNNSGNNNPAATSLSVAATTPPHHTIPSLTGSDSSWAPAHPRATKDGRNESEDAIACSTIGNSTFLTGSLGSLHGTERQRLPELQQPQRPGEQLSVSSLLRQPAPASGGPLPLSPDSSQLLSTTETQLCSSLGITPVQFISLKVFFILNPEEEVESNLEKVIQNHIKSNGCVLAPIEQI